eukprot:187732_1
MQEPPEIVQHIITRVNEKKVPAVKSYWTPLYTAFGREGEPYVNAILHMGFDVTSFPLNGRFHDSSRFLGKVIGPGGLSKVSETFEDFELPSDPVDSRRIMSLFPRPIAYWGYFILLNFHTFNEAYEKVAPGGILDLSIAIGAPDSFEHIVYPCEEFAALYHKTEKEALAAAVRAEKAALEAAERTAKAEKEAADRTAAEEKEKLDAQSLGVQKRYAQDRRGTKRPRDEGRGTWSVQGDSCSVGQNFEGGSISDIFVAASPSLPPAGGRTVGQSPDGSIVPHSPGRGVSRDHYVEGVSNSDIFVATSTSRSLPPAYGIPVPQSPGSGVSRAGRSNTPAPPRSKPIGQTNLKITGDYNTQKTVVPAQNEDAFLPLLTRSKSRDAKTKLDVAEKCVEKQRADLKKDVD